MLALYPALLGDSWSTLAPAVQRLHRGAGKARGMFRVRRGTSALARLVASLLRMPPSGDDVPTTLEVEDVDGGERWIRSFGGLLLATLQSRRGGLLVEAFGLVRLLFCVRAAEGALVFEQVAARLGAGSLAFPLPRVLAPTIAARAEADGDRVHVKVTVRAPLLGVLVEYDGRVAPEGA